MDRNPCSMSANIPPLVTLTPAGGDRAAIFASISAPTAWVSAPMVSPVILADRCPSVRVIVTGPS